MSIHSALLYFHYNIHMRWNKVLEHKLQLIYYMCFICQVLRILWKHSALLIRLTYPWRLYCIFGIFHLLWKKSHWWRNFIGSFKWNMIFFHQTLQWRHDELVGVSNHQRLDCLLNRLFRRRSKKTSKLRFPCLCEGNSPVTTGDRWIPRAKGKLRGNISICWRHHDISLLECQIMRPVIVMYITVR